MADQVPRDPQPGPPFDLDEPFLDAVLAEVGQTDARAGFDGLQRERLRDGYEPDGVRTSAGCRRGAFDAFEDASDVRGQGLVTWRRTQRSALQFGDA